MKRLIMAAVAVCLILPACALAQPEKITLEPKEIPLWPGAIPDAHPAKAAEKATVSTDLIAGKPVTAIENVTTPTMTIYPPKGMNTGAALIVFPGGGYRILAIDFEGTEVCDWATARGMTCVVLKYRVPGSGPWWDKSCNCHHTDIAPQALEDAQRAMGLLRRHATKYGIDPHKIGVLGFSAGGHLVADISTHFTKRAYAPVDAADTLSIRPDFAIALYPGHIWGDEYSDKINHDIVDNITAETPPTFLLQNQDDPVDNIRNSLTYFEGLRSAGVPTEMHVYAHGGHAFGLRETDQPATHWPRLVEAWLQGLQILPK